MGREGHRDDVSMSSVYLETFRRRKNERLASEMGDNAPFSVDKTDNHLHSKSVQLKRQEKIKNVSEENSLQQSVDASNDVPTDQEESNDIDSGAAITNEVSETGENTVANDAMIAAEDMAEGAAEEPTEEAVEELTEEAAEDMAEEAAEEPAEEAVGDVREEAAEDMAEEAAEEPAEEEVEDMAEGAAEEPAEKAAEEPAEEEVEDMAEGAAEEPAEKAAEDSESTSNDLSSLQTLLDDLSSTDFDKLTDSLQDEEEMPYDDISKHSLDNLSEPPNGNTGNHQRNQHGIKIIAAVLSFFLLAILASVFVMLHVHQKNTDRTKDESETVSSSGIGVVSEARDADDTMTAASTTVSSATESSETIAQPTTAATTAQSRYRALKMGERSEEVKNMQERLHKLQYMDKDSCTGYYGEFTQKRLKLFQKNAGLPQTGMADSETLERLYAKDAPKCVW